MTDQLKEKLSREQELDRDRTVTDLEAVLRLPQGRRVLLSILDMCGVYRSAYTGERAATDFRLGEQNVGLWLISQIETVSPNEYPALLLERANRAKEQRIAVVDEE